MMRRALVCVVAAAALGGCSTLTSWMPSIPAPWTLGWFSSRNKPGPMPDLVAKVTPTINWQASVGKVLPGFTPAVTPDAIYAAATDGTLVRLDPATGRVVWRISVDMRLSAGVGADAAAAVVGTEFGDVIAVSPDGKIAWKSKVSSEVTAPPAVAGGIAVIYAGDGRVFALDIKDGKTRWVYQRQSPPLIVRNSAPATVSHGGAFVGTAGGRLVALDATNGIVGWEAAVAVPKGATELERIADVTSPPLIDGRNVCATAFQGRTVCFDALRGTSIWSRDIASYGGMTQDAKNFYITEDTGTIQALDKSTGATLWKQDVLKGRRIGGPQIVGDYVGAVDIQGWLHLLAAADGTYVGRIATDGAAPATQPAASATGAVWQSLNGTVFSVGVR
ncbi:MAG TPA: outer membrane protein assembly factor BamB [Casimicrobiaceae bacterium]|nr:outer membrane protein assembly factor BamB [Casimicrobiaceae bacterium]